jgi:hypothetical protein
MTPVESNDHSARRQLERILSSAGFAQNERLSGFLRFVVDRHFMGRDEELKETVIAAEVFGRRPDYNPKKDSIVRTEAGRLRARLGRVLCWGGRRGSGDCYAPKGGLYPSVSSVRGSGREGQNVVAPASASPRLCCSRSGCGGLWLVVDSTQAGAHQHCGSAFGRLEPGPLERLLRRRALVTRWYNSAPRGSPARQ